MKLFRSLRRLEAELEDAVQIGSDDTRHVLRNVGWLSAGITVLALGLMVGREIRGRYKFARRTPYDLYSHSGDQVQDVELGVGI